MMTNVSEALSNVRERIAMAAQKAGREPAGIRLVAVSKRQPLTAIEAAYAAGQRDFGENYAQDLRDRARALSHLSGIRWHFIGHLQRNKMKYVTRVAAVMECIDSIESGRNFAASAKTLGRCVDVFLQVNVGEEPQKFGCEVGEAPHIAAALDSFEGIRLTGLMTVPPFELDADDTAVYFDRLAHLRDSMGGAARLPELSMGMSHDFEVAIEKGATVVRVGTAIFGERLS